MTIVDVNWGMVLLGLAMIIGVIAIVAAIVRYAIHLRRDIRDVKKLLEEEKSRRESDVL